MREINANQDAQFFRMYDASYQVAIELSGSDFRDETLFVFDEQGSVSFDRMLGVTKIISENGLSLFLWMGEQKLVIQILPLLEVNADNDIALGTQVSKRG